MNSFIKNHQTAFGLLGFVISAMIATIYLFVVPDETADSKGLLAAALPYAHSACWALLAIAGLLFAGKASKKLINFVSLAALACYAVFIVALLLV